MKKILIVILLLISITQIKAYENNYFTINIPTEYKENIIENNVYKWTKDNNYIAITINDNTKLKYDIKLFNQSDIEKQKEYIEEGINKGLIKYNITSSVTNTKKIEKDGFFILEYDVYFPSKEKTGYDIYQKGRMYTTNKYILNIIYSSDKIINENEEYNEIINSIKVFDEPVKEIQFNMNYIYAVIAIGTILGIIGYFIERKKRK